MTTPQRRLVHCCRFLLPALVCRRADRGRRLTAALQRLGGLWIKAGQQFASRYDLLPADICDALQVLYAGADGLTGSVATVRREGNRAVKELRPEAVAEFRADLALLAWMATVGRFLLPRLQLGRMVEELRDLVTEETDLRYEAARQDRARARLRKHGIRVPRVFLADSGHARLEMEWVDGVRLLDYLSMSDAERGRHWRHRSRRLAKRPLQSLLRQIFEEPEFHADMHPGNILLTRTGIWLIDFGGVGIVDGDFLAKFRAFVRALTLRHYARAAQVFCLLVDGLNRLWFAAQRVDRLQRRLVVVMQQWAARTSIQTLPYRVKSINALTQALMVEVLRSHGAMQWAWLRLQRALSSLDGTIEALWPTVDVVAVADRYLRQAAQRTPCQVLSVPGTVQTIVDIVERLDEYTRIETASLRIEGLMKGL